MDVAKMLQEICIVNKNYQSQSWIPPQKIICNKGDFTFDCIPTYSSDIFPRLLKYNDEYCVIWDECYWHIFDSYIEGFLAMNHGIENTDDKMQTYAINKLICILSYYLALSFWKIDLGTAAFFASIYYKHNKQPNATFDSETNKQLNLYKGIARVLCLLHETSHFTFRQGMSGHSESIVDFYIEILRETNGLKKWVFYPPEAYPHSEDDALSLIDEHLNGKLKEEISCDILAFINCITGYDHYFPFDKEASFSEKCAKLYEVFLIIDSLQLQTSNIKTAWHSMYLDIKKNATKASIDNFCSTVDFEEYARFSLKELFVRLEIEMRLLERNDNLQLKLLLEGEHTQKINDMVFSAMFSKEFLEDFVKGDEIFSMHNKNNKIRIIKYLLGWENEL